MWLKTEGDRPLGLPNFSKTPAFWGGWRRTPWGRWGVQMKSLQAQDGDTQQLLPEAQPEGWPAGRAAGNGAVLRSPPPWCEAAGTHCSHKHRKLKGSCASAQISRAYDGQVPWPSGSLTFLLRPLVKKKKKAMRRNSTIELGYKCWWLDFTATQRAQVSDSHKEYINFGWFFFF